MGTLSGRTPLLDRQRERAELDGLLGDVRSGRGRALVLRGEAGVGKSALLQHTVGQAADMRVVRAIGAEAEMELAYASLHLLVAPLLDRIEKLPGPQCDALAVAFGLREGAAPDRFMVGLAVLTLLAEAAEERALLCVIDDAQWLDQASAQVLAFVARRLLAEPVGLIFAAREPGRQFHGLADLNVRGLPEQDAETLLRSVVRFPLDERIRDRILAETNGNPLALLELPRGDPVAHAGRCGRADRRPRADLARGRAARGSRLRGGARAGRGVAGDRDVGAVPASAGAVGGVLGRVVVGATGGARGAGRGDRSRVRPRSPGLASRARGAGGRRVRGRRAGAARRPGSGARRHRGGGGVPEAGDRADARSGRTRSEGAGRGAGRLRGRRPGHGAGAARVRGDVPVDRTPERTGGPAARPDRLRAQTRR